MSFLINKEELYYNNNTALEIMKDYELMLIEQPFEVSQFVCGSSFD